MPHGEHGGSEELLIQEAIAGDKQAFGRLYEIYADQIVRYIYFRIGEQTEAMDMMEMVFLKAWENLPGFGGSGKQQNFRAWLYRIAHNALVDHHRSKKTEVNLDEIPELRDAGLSPGRMVEEAEQSRALLDALENIDEQSRQVITLRFLSGLSSKETAEIIGISSENVRVIQFRAVRKLRELMGEHDE
jgi:RNA polymerase sigma-70 factor, ECF subfamily